MLVTFGYVMGFGILFLALALFTEFLITGVVRREFASGLARLAAGTLIIVLIGILL